MRHCHVFGYLHQTPRPGNRPLPGSRVLGGGLYCLAAHRLLPGSVAAHSRRYV